MLERRHTNNNPKLQWVRFHLTGFGVEVCKVNSKSLNFSGEKPFECKLCHQRSRDYSAMIKHLRTHNGASPYQCTICQDFCPSLAAMQKHMKGHKPEDVPADWRIEKTYLYVCYVWAGLGPHAESNTNALSVLGEKPHNSGVSRFFVLKDDMLLYVSKNNSCSFWINWKCKLFFFVYLTLETCEHEYKCVYTLHQICY